MNPELLLDIAKLLRKYPAEVWEDLIRELNSPSFREKVLYALREMQSLSRQSRALPRHMPEREADEVAFRRAMLLSQVRAELSRRSIAEIREYADSLGVGADATAKKETLIRRIVKALGSRDLVEIERIKVPSLFRRPLAQDYERWGELIMGKKGKEREKK